MYCGYFTIIQSRSAGHTAMPPSKVDIATKIKFSDICRMLEKIKNANGARQKEVILQKYIESFNDFSKQFKLQNHDSEYSFYSVLRCLIPNADHARGSYGIQLTTMGRLYIKVLGLAPTGEDARKLNQTDAIKGTSDYADVVYSVMQNRSQGKDSSFSMADIHQLLDVIAENDRRKTEAELSKFIEGASALEQKWLIRIVLKRLHLGLGEQKIFSLYHPMAKEFYARTTDLKRVCECVNSGKSIDISDSVQPHQYIRPMLCEPLDLKKVGRMLSENVYYLETKMDGERFQLHLLDEKFKYISRNGKDFTSTFGSSASEGNLTPLIAKCFAISVQNIILDGEMMVWDRDLNGYRVKGENYDVKSLQRGGRLRPCFVIYDVLFLNGVSHVDKPYAERIALLDKIIKQDPGVVTLCKRTKVESINHLIDSFNEALNMQEEGVVIKAQNSVYRPGLRTGGWYKIKPDYIHGVIRELDLMIIGGYYNRKRSYIESYALGVYKKDNDNTEAAIFYSVAKVGLGLSYAQRVKLNDTLKPHWNNVHRDSKSSNNASTSIEWGSCLPDVWVDPRKSVVLQIKATELVETTSFRATHTLRFPRIQAVRDDKAWHDCLTLEEFESYCQNQPGVAKINKRNLKIEDLQPAKKLKLSPSKKHATNNNPYAAVFNANEVTKISSVCEGLHFCILSTTQGKPPVDQLKAMALRYGGKIVENPLLDSKKCICVAGDITPRIRRIIATGKYNIVSVDWMVRSFGSGHFSGISAQPKPRDMICMTSDMEEEFKKYYDHYGDSYTDNVDGEELRMIISDMKLNSIPNVLDIELCELENQVFFDENDPKTIFRRMKGHFYSSSAKLSNILVIAKLMFQSKGGACIEGESLPLCKKPIQIFIDRTSLHVDEFNHWMHTIFGKHKSRPNVLSYNWILDCDNEQRIIDQTGYLVYENDCT